MRAPPNVRVTVAHLPFSQHKGKGALSLSLHTHPHPHTQSHSYIEHVLHQEAGSWAEFDKVDWRWFSICQPFTRRPGPEHLSSGGRMGRRTGRRDGEFDVPCFDSHQAQPVTFVHVKHTQTHTDTHTDTDTHAHIHAPAVICTRPSSEE